MLTIFVVVATANHWWLDGIVATLVLVACAWGRHGVVALWHRIVAHPDVTAEERTPTTAGVADG